MTDITNSLDVLFFFVFIQSIGRRGVEHDDEAGEGTENISVILTVIIRNNFRFPIWYFGKFIP